MANFPSTLLLLLHFVGWAVLLGGLVTSLRGHHHFGTMLIGALTSLVSGAVLLGMRTGEAAYAGVSPMMITKIVLTAAITGLVFFGYRLVSRHRELEAGNALSLSGAGEVAAVAVAPWLKYAIGALTLLTLAISLIWR